ncbi:MAG: adenosine-specific kinase [Candidatus Thermoplasmatota archaeon]|nr:adenosine-specific kinase [Candidatus Thermoplasmatota archaeon]
MELRTVKVEFPESANVIIGQTHFIKTTEDLYEAIVSTVPQARFGVAFCEASGPCLVRVEGNDDILKKAAEENAVRIGAGHTFVVVLENAYPINVLNRIKDLQEVCGIFCATANPVEVIVAENERGRGILGVIDGEKPKGVETEKDAEDRKAFLRKIGYKR